MFMLEVFQVIVCKHTAIILKEFTPLFALALSSTCKRVDTAFGQDPFMAPLTMPWTSESSNGHYVRVKSQVTSP